MTDGLSTFAQAVAGALCTVLFAGVVFVGTQYALGTFEDRYEVDVVLGELGQGIIAGSDVRVRDVLVGEVSDIRLDEGNRALITLSLDPRYQIPERAHYEVNARTLLGEKQVEIVFDGGIDEGPYLADGTVVDDADRVVELQDVLADLAELFAAVDPDDLAVLVNDGLGAFDGQGPAIGRAIDQGARAAGTFRRSLDDQIAAQRDLSLVAQRLGPEGETFNRMGRELVRGLPTISDNRVELVTLLNELQRFSRVLNATFTVDRANLDRMIISGDSVTRMLFAYSTQLGELMTGLVQYTELWTPGFMHEGIDGQAARFQALIDIDDVLQAEFCEDAPPELAEGLPLCQGGVNEALSGARDGARLSADGGRALLELPVAAAATRPEGPERHGVDDLVRRSLPALPEEGVGP